MTSVPYSKQASEVQKQEGNWKLVKNPEAMEIEI